MSKLVHLQVENFKKIEAIEIFPVGPLITITGENDSGKTSLIESIAYLFGGSEFKPEAPIRIGSEVCTILGRLDNGLTLKRRVTATSDKLTIESEDGATFKKPQDVADKLFNPIAFEPDSFTRLSAKEQAAMLRLVTGLNTAIIDAERDDAYANRAAANKSHKELLAKANAIVIPPHPGEIPAVIDVVGMMNDKARLVGVKAENDKQRESFARRQRELAMAKDVLQGLFAERDAILNKIKSVESQIAGATEKIAAEAEVVAALADPDMAAIDAKVQESLAANRIVAGKKKALADHEAAAAQAKSLADLAGAKAAEAEKFDAIVTEKTKARQEMLAKANMPYPGMTVEGDEVLVNGVPFSQASSSEQTRIGMAMAMAEKKMKSDKAVRLCLIKDGDRIGDAKRAEIVKWATENGIDVYEERVLRPGIVGIVIEDGKLKSKGEAAVEADGQAATPSDS